VVFALSVACSKSSPAGHDTPQVTCQKANDIQRKATAAESAIASGSAGAKNAIDELGGAVLGARRAAESGTPPAIDLAVVANDVDRLGVDFNDKNPAVSTDVNTLKDSLIKLGMDCSNILTG